MKMSANAKWWLLLLVVLNVVLLLRSQQDRHAALWADAGIVGLFLLLLLATRIWPNKIWLRGDGPRAKG